MTAHAQACWPDEACGLLAGLDGVVRRVYVVENVLHSAWEYQMDPRAQVRVMLEIEAAGWELSGIFHSHPQGPPAPSATDVARSYYPDCVHVILAPEGGVWRGRGFLIVEGQVDEIALNVLEG
jgi:proteasome lid subunit RPN8/RPN11